MKQYLLVLLQVNVALTLFYLGYYCFLRRLTFFQHNRFYLLFAIIYAFICPFVSFEPDMVQRVPVLNTAVTYIPDWSPIEQDIVPLEGILFFSVLGGSLLIFGQLCYKFWLLFNIAKYSFPDTWKGYDFKNTPKTIQPFSFWKTIYLNISQHKSTELSDIFRHEQAHIDGLHSFDMILAECCCIVLWINPFSWLMKKAIVENLEFLTDNRVLEAGVNRKAYQFSLLNVAMQGKPVNVTNQFNYRILKRRIIMMNKQKSSKLQLGKYLVMIPFLASGMMVFTVTKASQNTEKLLEVSKAVVQNNLILQDTTAKEAEVSKKAAQGVVKKNGTKKHVSFAVVVPKDTVVNGTEARTIIITDKPEQEGGKDESTAIFRFKAKKVNSSPTEVPIVIVDGKEVKYEELAKYEPQTINSINVLKGEKATSQYGQRAKNGVLEITLKK